jgi:hypothetical protein
MKRNYWLWELCELQRKTMSSPFSWEHNGKRYDCATTGTVLVMLEGEEFQFRDDAPDLHLAVSTETTEFLKTPLSELKRWAFGEGQTCDECRGYGSTENPYEYDELICNSCHGSGFKENLPGQIGQHVFNRRLLWGTLRNLPDGEVTIALPENWAHPGLFSGDGWIVWAMGVRQHDDEKPRETFPNLSVFRVQTEETAE